MAIECFIGSVGGGKSYSCVKRMNSYMARGGRVVSNIELVGYDKETKEFAPDAPPLLYLASKGWQYQSGQYIYIPFDEMCDSPEWFEKVPAGASRDLRTLLVVDEATDLFDNLDRDKVRTDSGYRALFRFLRLSRHAHIDVLFICQDLAAINSRLRGLITSGWRSTDMGKYRLPFLKVRFPFDLFMLQQFDRRMEMETRREWLPKDQAIFACYRSEVFGSELGVSWDGVAISDGTIKKDKKKMNIIEKLALFLALGLSVFAIVRGGRSGSPFAVADSQIVNITNLVSSVVASLPTSTSNTLAASAASVPRVRFYRGKMVFLESKYSQGVIFEGRKYFLGAPSEFGKLVSITFGESALFLDSGNSVYLLPASPSGFPKPNSSSPYAAAVAPLPAPF